METLENRREKMSIKLIKDMKDPMHKLDDLLSGEQHGRATRKLMEINSINFNCRTERFSNSPLVYPIRKYNIAFDNL